MTYETSAAPFLAVNSLFKIAGNSEEERIAKIIKEDFYMDDLMTGADSIEECQPLAAAAKDHLSKFNFPLRKWLPNNGAATINNY